MDKTHRQHLILGVIACVLAALAVALVIVVGFAGFEMAFDQAHHIAALEERVAMDTAALDQLRATVADLQRQAVHQTALNQQLLHLIDLSVPDHPQTTP